MPSDYGSAVALKVSERRAKVAAFYARDRMSQMEIAERLHVDQSTVSRDIAALQEYWTQRAFADLDQLRQAELAKIDVLEREAWDSFEASKHSKVVRHAAAETGEKSKRVRRRTSTTNTGNPAFLSVIRWCISERVRILGLALTKNTFDDWRSDVMKAGGDPDAIYKDLYTHAVAALSSGPEEGNQ